MTVLDVIVRVDRANRIINKYENLENRTTEEDEILDSAYDYRELLYSLPIKTHK